MIVDEYPERGDGTQGEGSTVNHTYRILTFSSCPVHSLALVGQPEQGKYTSVNTFLRAFIRDIHSQCKGGILSDDPRRFLSASS